jgi:subtilisin family serine protease
VESIKIPSSTLTHKYVVRLPHDADAEKIAARHGMRVVKQLKFHHRMGESKHGKGRYFLFERVEVASEDGSLAQFPHLHEAKEVHWYEQQVSRTRFKRSDPGVDTPTDPLFNSQWHLHNTPGVDVEIASVWSTFSGSGVTIAIVDDGLDWRSAEFSSNYRADCSYDVNFDDSDPTPYTYDVHGTAAAGVAAADVNQMCGVGVAPNARIAGIRVLADDVADFQEAEAVAYARYI